MRSTIRLLLLCALASHAAGWARERLNADTLAQFGGTYSMACGNPTSAKLRVTADALVVESGNQRMTGTDPQASYSFFGQSPPRGFQVALQSQVRGMAELMFMVYRDRGGNYVELDGAPNVRAVLGPSLTGRRYRQCDGAAMAGGAPLSPPSPPSSTARPTMPPPPPQATPPGGSPLTIVADPRFKRTWRATLGSAAREPWLAEMDGPAPEPRWVTVDGTRYVLNSFCKAHDCYDYNVVQLYNPSESRIYALVHRLNGDTLVGNPPPQMVADLRRLWQGEFRKSR
ncbi:Ivy family c-type lysozyme inhibitor [Variovorax ureilyticus]|uniref:Ivy family c-type lysozyme inhibitor n=1 Tax=Variovorax ureilyticus TaxID=1836198 RepID=A0ABU8V885_9BURK